MTDRTGLWFWDEPDLTRVNYMFAWCMLILEMIRQLPVKRRRRKR